MSLYDHSYFLVFMALGHAFMYCVFRALTEIYEFKGMIIFAGIIILAFVIMCIVGDPSPLELIFYSVKKSI